MSLRLNGEIMKLKTLPSPCSAPAWHWAFAQAQTEIQWWHSMTAVNNEWVNDLAKDFNASQKEVQGRAHLQGQYDESMTAAIAAFRAGNAPHILQVFEVGTATMMASKGAIVPVGQVMKDAGYKFDPAAYMPAVAGYYTAPNGQMLSFPFNSSTTVFYTTRTPSRPPASTPDKPPQDLAGSGAGRRQAQGQRPQVPADHRLAGLDAARELLDLAQRRNRHQAQRPGGMDARLKMNSPLHVRHIENLANMAKQGLFVYKGRANVPEATFMSGECAMITTSSGFYGNVKKNAKFDFGWPPCPTTPTWPARRRTP
jgi:sn-glycerol 3-phosphate transport system substrate-binding protein